MYQTGFHTDARHDWFDGDVPRTGQANIGADGGNLTLVFLSMNRAALSIRLLRSLTEQVPHFAGQVLIGDNGSDAAELAELEAFCRDSLRCGWRILRFGVNCGVAGGRNRAFREVKTDWILSLDNDIFLIADPFAALQRDLSSLGCHFLSVPLLNPDLATFYAFGGQLQTLIQDGQPRLTISTVLPPGAPVEAAQQIRPEGDGFLCSFLFGGASLLRRDSFQALGGFDDGMFIGFEDIDFSLRLWRGGMKVGSAALACFVHDHPAAEAESDRSYERARFSRQKLHEAARHLEAKHGFRVWGEEVENWLIARERQQQILGAAAAGPIAAAEPTPRKPHIALVTDTGNWAFANIARQIIHHLGDKYDFDLIPMTELGAIEEARWMERGRSGTHVPGGGSGINQLLLVAPDYDLVHVFWREYLTLIGSPALAEYAARLGLTDSEFERDHVRRACITTSVYDHLHSTPEAIAERRPVFNTWTAGYTVSSGRLDRLYRGFDGLRPPAAVIEDGVSPELFHPIGLGRFATVAEREIVVGWVGNSRWAASLGDKKGVHSILIPTIEMLRAEGLPIRLELADRQDGFIPHEQMVEYYAKIDVYVCTSEIEGTPNPVLEAMACGVPVVTTDVGVVPEVFGPGQQAFILAERSAEALAEALRRLLRQPALFARLSAENLARIADWSWRSKTEKFDRFFTAMLEQRATGLGERQTKLCMLPFTTPSMEPDGSIRLCSASSIFDYRAETNMGNARAEGLEAVWRGGKYRHIRRTLLSGEALTPYCQACEYRREGPAWLFQLHLALHAWDAGLRSPELHALLQRRAPRYAEYCAEAPDLGLQVLPLPALDPAPSPPPGTPLVVPEALIDGKDLPIYVDLNTLNRCNVSCLMCPPAIKHDDLGERRDPYYRLTLKEFETVTGGLNVTSAHFVGAYAEPLLNKEIFALVGQAHARGIFTAITTNAMPLSRDFAERLVDAGLDMMSISLHGATAATAEAIMRRSRFDRVLENIRQLQAVKAARGTAKPEVYFNFVSQRLNVGEIADFIDLAAGLRVSHVNIIHLIDGDDVVRAEDNLVLYPDLLVPQLREALRRGTALGVQVHVSPAYRGLMDDYPADQGQPALMAAEV
ncbi:glycosyltransferase [Dankookia sp. GCM10030260]|uniref:glycosyltransferase n=1 Tax=Dankookia sp. GCM10030260 TaxID=3273390 RepID=UPI00361789C5